jgi:hypothetical protein
MKTGIIVYIVGENAIKKGLDIEAEVRKQQPRADRIELVAKNEGHFDISDAWWSLTAKGMQQILCIAGEITAAGRLHLKDRVLRLCG